MKKNIIVFGLISGFIVSVLMLLSMSRFIDSANLEHSMVLGYTSMLIAFVFVFVGIKNQRDKHNLGVITFGQGFKTGFWITLIASTMYVITWMIDFHYFIPDFMNNYAAQMIDQAKAAGKNASEIEKIVAEMDGYKEMYKNPLYVALMTYMEILPLGIIITLISAFILKRKNSPADFSASN